MKGFIKIVHRVDISFHAIAGLVLAFMMVVTMADVILRAFGRPMVGAVELISFSGAIVIGFAIPYSSWKRVHVVVDVVTEKLSDRSRAILQGATKSIGLLFFLFVSYNFIIYGFTLIKTGEVSPGFKIPYYPITFGLALACFVEALTLLCDLIRLAGGGDRE